MKHIRETLKYFTASKFFFLTLIALVPSACILVIGINVPFAKLLQDFSLLTAYTFRDIIDMLFMDVPIWALILAFVLASIGVAYILGLVDRDMRVGVFKPRYFLKSINHNVLPSIVLTFGFFVILICAKILICLMFAFWHAIFTSEIFFKIFCALSIAAVYFGLECAFSSVILMIPIMIDRGLGLKAALAENFFVLRGRFWKMFLTVVVIDLIRLAVLALLYLVSDYFKLGFDVVFNSLAIVFYLTFSYVVYYDISGRERHNALATYN